MRNYYGILGLPPGCADAGRIKAQYRRLARLYHPDRNRSPEAPARFRAVLEAYEVLSDPARRAAYETERAAWLRALGAVGCPACGQANRIEPGAAGTPLCGRCGAALAAQAPREVRGPRAVVRDRLPRLVERVGETVLDGSAELVDEVLEAGFASLRQRLGLGRGAR